MKKALLFLWLAASLAAAPNTPIRNLIIQNNAGTALTGIAQMNGASPVSVLQDSIYNITTYGASPAASAATNNTAITAAMNAAIAAGGGTIYTPFGTYTTTTVTVSSSVGLTFEFADRASSIWKASVNTAPVLTITGSNVTIKGGGFDGAYVSGASSGTSGIIYLNAAKNIIIDDCLIQNGLRNGVLMFGECQYIKITNTRLYRNYCSIRSFEDVPNNKTSTAITVNKCELISNWDHTGNDQTGGVKLQSNGVTGQSAGHSITDNYIYNVGLLPIEMWTGENGVFRNSVISGNRIFGIDSGDQWGVSLNGCFDVVVIGNSIRLTNGYVGIEAANECQRCLIVDNTINLFASNGTTKSSATGIGIYNNSGYSPKYTKISNNTITGGSDGIHTQNTITPTTISGNKIRDFSGILINLQGSSYLTITSNTLEGDCTSQIAIFGDYSNITDIDIGYNTFSGDASHRNVWGYNSSTAHTFTNFHFHHNDGKAATFTGYDSWYMGWDSSELINMIREENYYVAGSGKADWPYLASADVPVPPFSPESQEFSIPIASKFTITVAASATDQWYKVFSFIYGRPLTMSMHVRCDFLAADNKSSSQTFFIAGSPYGQAAGISKLPSGYYQGAPLKGIIYDNPSAGATHEIWLRFGPTGGGTAEVGGADFASSWIVAPTVVASAPTYNANHYELDTVSNEQALKTQYAQTNQLNIAASGYANFGTAQGSSGYGFRDNSGVMQFKDSGGAWNAFGGTPGVNSVAGTAGQVLVNGGTSAQTGAVTFSLPSALTGINSITSATVQPLTLATLDSNANVVLDPHGTGEVLVNANTAAAPTGFTGTLLHLNGSDALATALTLDTYTGIARLLLRKANTSGAAPSAIGTGTNIGRVAWQGYGTSAYSSADRAFINVNATENWTNTAQGTAMTLSITNTGGTTAINWAGATPTQIAFSLPSINTLVMTATDFTAAGKLTMTGPATTVAAGGSSYHAISASLTGDSGGTSDIRAFNQVFTLTGSNNVAFLNGVYASAINAQTGGVVSGLIASTYQTISSNASNTTAVAGAVSLHTMTGTGNVTGSYEAFVVDPPTYSSTGRITGTFTGFSIPLDSGNSSITTWAGADIANQTKGSGEAYAYRGRMTSGTGKYNLYMDGTAQNYLAGNLTLGAAYIGSVQNLSGAGAANVTTETTALATTGAAQAITLADGVNGQTKIIIHDVDGGSAVLTPTTKTGFSTVTFTNAGESVTLKFLTTRGWIVTGSYLAVIAP